MPNPIHRILRGIKADQQAEERKFRWFAAVVFTVSGVYLAAVFGVLGWLILCKYWGSP